MAYNFTGRELDESTGFYYFGARYFDPRANIWISPDPALNRYVNGGGSDDGVYSPPNINLYVYVQQRPLGSVDPDGEACISSYFSNYCRRSRLYRYYDSVVTSHTRFFGAASMTTNMLGSMSGIGEGLGSVVGVGITGETETRMKEISTILEPLNTQRFNEIRRGEEQRRGPELDRAMVNMEQTAVQGFLDKLKKNDPGEYERFVSEVNETLNPVALERGVIRSFSGSDAQYLGVLDQVVSDLGCPIDFASQADREAIGNALAGHVRNKGMPR